MGKNTFKTDFKEAYNVLKKFIDKEDNFHLLEQAGEIMIRTLRAGKKIIACGNGGSMCDAMHFCEELTGKFRDERRALAAIAISDPSYISCIANDYGYEQVFARFIEATGQQGDVLLAISTSGKSKNLILAAQIARQKNMYIVALTGKDGGELAQICDIELRAPYSKYSDRTQEIHIKIIHSLINYIEHKLIKQV